MHHRRKSSLSSIASSLSLDSIDEPLVQKFRKLDVYAGPKAEFRRGTLRGAVLSFISFALAIFLFWRELQFSFEVTTAEKLSVDTTSGYGFNPSEVPKINFTFDITFPVIPCSLVSVSADDLQGKPQVGTVASITKTGIGKDGGVRGVEELKSLMPTYKDELALLGGSEEAEAAVKTFLSADSEGNQGGSQEDCGGCYGAGEDGECCNTCEEVRLAYRRKGWGFDPVSVAQCRGEVEENEGCRLAGNLKLTGREGNVHFAPGMGAVEKRGDALEDNATLLKMVFSHFNSSHTINRLAFGEPYPGVRYPLEGESRAVLDKHGMYQYYVKVVPTTYVDVSGKEVSTNQYSVTEHVKHVRPGSGRGLPGLYFHYEISPISSRVQEHQRGWLSFFTGVSAIVGGVYTVLGLISHVLDMLLDEPPQ
ncbi:unnamed protein product [Chrysoparadoxa australica]